MGKMKWCFAFLFGILILSPSVFAFDHIVINSENWQDVYSGLYYATLSRVPADFLVSNSHAPIVLDALDKNNEILVLSSSRNPYVFNYPEMFLNYGYAGAEEISADNLNLELINAEGMEDIQNFVIVSDDYGYNAIAVTPYARLTNSWVFFADDSNIDEIDDILSERDAQNVLIYGYVEPGVRDVMEKYSPDVIYNVNRFQDNIDIVNKYIGTSTEEVKQVLLTNGDFLELELVTGEYPVMFTGLENVPEIIQNYLKESDFEVGVLIGNELVGAATNIRRSTGLFVMVKFARGARQQTSGVAAVEGLDIFPVPAPLLSLDATSVDYNVLTNNLELTYKSSSNIPIWIKGTITLGEGEDTITCGDQSAIFINPNNYKTVIYSSDENSENYCEGLAGFNLDDYSSANVFTIYGESQGSLDRIFEGSFDISTVEVIDNCEMDIESVKYYKNDEEFKIKVKNTGEVDCYVEGVINGLVLDLEERTIGSNGVIQVGSGDSGEITIKQAVDEENLLNNEFVNTRINFGERETSLVKTQQKELELKIIAIALIVYVIVVLAIAAVLFFVLYIYKRRKEKKSFRI